MSTSEGAGMSRRDWLVLLLGLKGDRSTVSLDPVRLQKGMFLFAKQANLPPAERYDFEAYHYGPYSFELRRDVEELVGQGIASARDVPGYTWKRYQLSAEGLREGRELVKVAPQSALGRLSEIKKRVTGQSFYRLLDDVYRQYPEMAERSVFRR